MPSEKTRADSLREYLTGAASAGGAQTDPNLALGGYRSASAAESLGISITNAIGGLSILFAGGANVLGAGTLHVVSANVVEWKDYGGSYGSSVTIANGETKIVEALDDPGAYLRITRTSATDLSGTATVTLSTRVNNLFGFDDTSSAEATAGDIEYRCSCLRNESSASVINYQRWIGELGTSQTSDGAQLGSSGAGTVGTTGTFTTWPTTGFCHIKTSGGSTREIVYYSSRTDTVLTIPAAGRGRLGTSAAAGSSTDTLHAVPGVAIAIDTGGVVAATVAAQTISDEDTAPTSVTWNTGITAATGLQVGTIPTTEQVYLWIKRDIPAGAVATTDNAVYLLDSFDAA